VEDASGDVLEGALRAACEEVAAADSQHLASVSSVLRRQVTATDDPLGAVIAGLEYHLVVEPEHRRHGPFGPMMEMQGRVYPTPLDMVDPPMVTIWARAHQVAPLLLVAARFADLLWERRFGERSHEWAWRAIDSYLAAAEKETHWHPIEVSDGAQRAFELAVRLSDVPRREEAVRVLVQLIRRSLGEQHPSPGVSLQLLELLARRRPEERPPELDVLVDDAVERYGHDPWLLESALDIKAMIAPPDQREALHSQQVDAFAGMARTSEGLVRYGHFQHAIELADRHGLRQVADGLRREVEAIPEDELGLQTVGVEINVPQERVEQYVNTLVGDDDLASALKRFGSVVPTGNPDANRSQVRQMMADYPLQFLATRMVIGSDNALIQSIQGEAEQVEAALTRYETQHLAVFGALAVEVLARMKERYGPVTSAASWFEDENELIEPTVGERIGHAVALYEAEDHDACASVLTPRIERIVRSAARVVGLSVTNSPDAYGRPGGVKGLGALLTALAPALPEATYRYLRTLLTEPTGINLRNRIAHGLVDAAGPQEAALLIHAVCHLRLLHGAATEAASSS
jgi:hypothetical protein